MLLARHSQVTDVTRFSLSQHGRRSSNKRLHEPGVRGTPRHQLDRPDPKRRQPGGRWICCTRREHVRLRVPAVWLYRKVSLDSVLHAILSRFLALLGAIGILGY
jgi:hypothetical protein